MTKLVIQIPCLNEAEHLPMTLGDLPKSIPGIDEIEVVVIDDGSHDATSEVARAHGAQAVVRHKRTLGLAAAFRTGLEECVRRGADFIVNTDADNQYRGEDVARLVRPLLEKGADLVVGDRGVGTLELFPRHKRLLQRFGSWVISKASGLEIPDATSGFRALTRETALRLIVLGTYSYTLESLIHAGNAGMTVKFVPITVNPPTRPSRLMRGASDYVRTSSVAIVRAYTLRRPLFVFAVIGAVLMALGLIPGVRFLYLRAQGQSGHVQSLILCAILLLMGFQSWLAGLLSDLVASNRKLLEELVMRARERDHEVEKRADRS
ncbi:MAG: glycosyltransferase family 2 protein [Deltaproteobacteria bacterium]|nr:glycosyltransferase family 2 protein [Deltaproteobacteria bacterium]